ncbi:MAG: histidine triad (HIT) family protein [Candidatus Tokpelaia sp. JSC189]|nr:MAG: histidine triad (HIT) family protein [Candidatus Tokpelaia sp. JSC189]
MILSYDENNIFAKLLRNEIPSIRVYEDENTVVFMDTMPQGIGHTLVIPRKPSRNLLDATPEILVTITKVVQKIAKATQKAFAADGITVMQFNEAASGQTVYHLHFHIIPRFDGIPLQHHADKIADKAELEKSAEKIRTALKII